MTTNLASVTLDCLVCKSRLSLKGQYAQRVSEGGVCPVCNLPGRLVLVTMKVKLGGTR